MANQKKTSDINDDLLSLDDSPSTEETSDFGTLVATPDNEIEKPDLTSVQQDDEDEEIARLKAELAKPLPAAEPVAPKKESELTPKERELRDLRDQMARRQATIAEASGDTYEETEGKDTVLIHTLVDGFTVNGQITYRGREMEFVVGGQAYEQTKGRTGKSWLDMTVDEQYERWGEQRFGTGPWPFKRLSALTLADLPDGSTEADLAAVKAAAARNDRRAPVFTTAN